MQAARTLAVIGLVASCSVGCGAAVSAPRGSSGQTFPSRATLQELAARPAAPDQASDRKTLAVDDWQPATDVGASATDAEALVQSAASAQGKRSTIDPELSCAAREIGRFYATHQAFPDQQLQAYMAGVCGMSAPTFSMITWSTPNDTLVDPANQQQWRKAISDQLGPLLAHDPELIGAAQVSDGKNTAFAAVAAKSAVAWEGRSLVTNTAGEVELSGSVRTPAAFVYGMANVGAYGVSDCRSDPRVALPRFRLTCRLSDTDAAAWVDVQALPPGRVLSRSVARLLIRREGAALVYSAPTKNSAPETVTDPTAFTKRLLALVNEARTAARLPNLALATRQSETSFRLAPHYFDNEASDQIINDQIALGLLAGWDVKGTIRTGDFYSNTLSGSLDPKRWLGFMLDQPSARRVLLDANARSIAIGADLRPRAQSMGALVSTYTFYDTDDHRADIQDFLARLNEHRSGLGLAPAKITQAPEVNSALRTIKSSHSPEGALQTALEQVVAREQRGVEGFYIEATHLAHLTFPEALLRPSITIAVSAAHHRYPEAAWGTLTLLVVLLDSSAPQQTAGATPPHG
jgi:hypothetical protein